MSRNLQWLLSSPSRVPGKLSRQLALPSQRRSHSLILSSLSRPSGRLSRGEETLARQSRSHRAKNHVYDEDPPRINEKYRQRIRTQDLVGYRYIKIPSQNYLTRHLLHSRWQTAEVTLVELFSKKVCTTFRFTDIACIPCIQYMIPRHGQEEKAPLKNSNPELAVVQSCCRYRCTQQPKSHVSTT